MNLRQAPYTVLLVFLLCLVAACGAAPASVAPTAPPMATVLPAQSHDAWTQARASLPATIVLYKPTYVPERFGVPKLLEARADQDYGAVYTIVYAAPGENLAFILNMGKGALGNFPPAERRESVTVLGRQAELESSTETHTIGVFWQMPGGNYQIKAYSPQMTMDEMKKIIDGLIQQ